MAVELPRDRAVGFATGKTYVEQEAPPPSTWERVERYPVTVDPETGATVEMERDLDSGESRRVPS